jgi:hypothetical protein
MRIAYPTVTNMGLGNNLITVAKAHLIADSCHMTYQPPTWPSNEHVTPPTKNGYGYYFPTTLTDRVRLQVFHQLRRVQQKLKVPVGPPVLNFGRADYERLGVEDIGEACAAYLEQRGLNDPATSAVVTTSGMWGGYAGIRRARTWLRSLLFSHADTRRRLEQIQARTAGRLRVAVNIKMGSYVPTGTRIVAGERCVRLPLEWYTRVCRLIREASDCNFILVTDGTREELAPFLDEIQPVHCIGESYVDLLGLLLLMHADLVVCSNSTYSRLGCFLNDRPYVWIADTLMHDPTGRYGYLWKDNGTPMPQGSSKPVPQGEEDSAGVRRCFALNADVSALPAGLVRYVVSGGKLPIEIPDDLLYGDPVRLLG